MANAAPLERIQDASICVSSTPFFDGAGGRGSFTPEFLEKESGPCRPE